MPTPTDPYSMPEAPDWLDAGDATKGLESELSGVDKYFNVSPYLKAYNRAAQGQYAMGLQQGQNAAGEAVQRSRQTGTFGSVNTSMISAQTALPFMQNLLDSKAKGAEIRLGAMEKNQAARANLAQSIANARTSYAGILANYITSIRGQNISGFLGEGQQKIGQQNADSNSNATYIKALTDPNSPAALKAWAASMMGLDSGSGAGASGFNPGYIPNQGPIIPGTGARNGAYVVY